MLLAHLRPRSHETVKSSLKLGSDDEGHLFLVSLSEMILTELRDYSNWLATASVWWRHSAIIKQVRTEPLGARKSFLF